MRSATVGDSRLPTPAAVVFDLDGTLVDTVPTRLAAWMRAFKEASIPADRIEVMKLIGSDGRRLAQVVAKAAHIDLDGERAATIDRRSGEIFNTLNTHPRPLPGVNDVLAALARRRIPWSIATSSMEGQVAASIDALRLSRRPRIVDGSHVAEAKPAPDLLLRAAQEMKASPEAMWYVGDATWDVKAAAAAGMPSIGVTTGYTTAEELRLAGAWRVIRELSGLLPIIEER